MRSYLRPSTHRRTSSHARSAGLRRIGRLIDPPQPDLPHHLRLVKGRMVPYYALHPWPLPRPEHLSYLHPPHSLHPVPPQPPLHRSTPNTKYTHSYLSSTRRLNFSPRLTPSACKAANSPPFSTPPAPAHPLSPPSAVAPSSDNPIAKTSRAASCTKPPPPVPSHTKPSPLLSSETDASRSLCAWAGVHASLTPLPNRCLATSSKPPASYHLTHR
jgi:hypothetical protein